jgi:aminopeptidase N
MWKILLILSISSTLSAGYQDVIDDSSFLHFESKQSRKTNSILNDKLLDNSTITYRLPNDTRPLKYEVFIKTDVDKAIFEFDGRVRILVRALEETSTVTLQYRDMSIVNVDLLNSDGEVINFNLPFEFVQPVSLEFLRIKLPQMMNVGDEFLLEILYNGTMQSQFSGTGFYRAYFVENGTTIWYGTTQFESTDARHAFPCYDEPGIRAPIKLQLQHDASYTAYANMPVSYKFPIPDSNYVMTVFEETPPMQTYLLAFLISPFLELSNNETLFPQKILAKPQSIRNNEAEFAASIANEMLMKFITHLNVNFSLPKLDHAAITQFSAGAMENWYN